jgi:hypothetical protein
LLKRLLITDNKGVPAGVDRYSDLGAPGAFAS